MEFAPLGGSARTADRAREIEEHRLPRGAVSYVNASEVLSALRTGVNADMTGAGGLGDRHPITSPVRRRANVLIDDIGCELSQNGVRVHRFPGSKSRKLAHAELATT